MKGMSLYRYIAAVLLFLGSISLRAQDAWPGVSKAWPNIGGDIGTYNLEPGHDWYSSESVSTKLVKDLNMSGTFSITKGAKLKIENRTGKTLYIRNVSSSDLSHMFYVAEHGILHIAGTNGKIIIDGGADFTWATDEVNKKHTLTKASGGKSLTNSAILCRGTLVLENVEIRNMDIINVDQSAIKIYPLETDMIGHGKTIISNCVITQCKAHAGPALIIHGNGTPTSANYTPEHCAVTLDNVKINKCYAIDNGTHWSGMIRPNGQFVGNLNVSNCEISYNYAEGGCAGLFWNAAGRQGTKCTLTGNNLFEYNYSGLQGGAIRVETNIDFKSGTTEVRYNHAHTIGGGLHVYGYAGGLIKEKRDLSYNLSSVLNIHHNTANNGGGGVAFEYTDECKLPDGSTVTASVNGAQIYNNSVLSTVAAFDNWDVKAGDEVGFGGGIYFKNTIPENHDVIKRDAVIINLNSGNIHDNTSNKGGGLYVNHTNVGCASEQTIYLTNNRAAVDGGGLYVNAGHLLMQKATVENNYAKNYGAGMCVIDGDIEIARAALITRNGEYGGEKTKNGGGVYLSHGILKMTTGEISQNTCKGQGGGLYVEAKTKAISEISGGIIHHNSAKFGGGMAISGYAGIDVKSVDIQYNTAVNGGGIFLTGNNVAGAVAAIKYHGGLIRNNSALGAMEPGSTAYGKAANEVSGYGAGIYMANNTSLEFVDASHIGIYDNLADTGADDIFASGNNTTIVLPNVNNMKLEGFDTELDIPNLYWMEDYCKSDPNYSLGINKIKDLASHGPNDRYMVYRKNLSEHYHVLEETDLNITNKYANIALGYPLVYLSIDKYGMKEGENAVFSLEWKNPDTGTYTHYMDVVVVKPLKKGDVPVLDSEGGIILSEKVALIEGEWRITEKNWSWGYKLVEPVGTAYIDRVLNTFSSDDYSDDTGNGYTGRRVRFVNAPIYTQEESLEHNEAVSENIFNKIQ